MPLPEMACYDPSRCNCLYYKGGDGKLFGSELFSGCGWSCGDTHFYSRHAWARVSEGVRTERHRPAGRSDGPVCLITTYERHIPLFTPWNDDKRNPSHAWLHAMDSDTYPRQPWSHELQLCNDTGCMNDYRRPENVHCVDGSFPIHYPCSCGETVDETDDM